MEGNTSVRPRRELSTADLAHAILRNHGQAMYYKDLIREILRHKDSDGESEGRLIAQMYSEISLDSRFHHKGQGLWALREWNYKGGRVINVRPDRPAPRAGRTPRLFEETEVEEDPVTPREEEGESRAETPEEISEEEWD